MDILTRLDNAISGMDTLSAADSSYGYDYFMDMMERNSSSPHKAFSKIKDVCMAMEKTGIHNNKELIRKYRKGSLLYMNRVRSYIKTYADPSIRNDVCDIMDSSSSNISNISMMESKAVYVMTFISSLWKIIKKLLYKAGITSEDDKTYTLGYATGNLMIVTGVSCILMTLVAVITSLPSIYERVKEMYYSFNEHMSRYFRSISSASSVTEVFFRVFTLPFRILEEIIYQIRNKNMHILVILASLGIVTMYIGFLMSNKYEKHDGSFLGS